MNPFPLIVSAVLFALTPSSAANSSHAPGAWETWTASTQPRTQASAPKTTKRKQEHPPAKKSTSPARRRPSTSTKKSPAAGQRPSQTSAARDTAAAHRKAGAADTVAPALRWPVAGRKILQPYGERTNPATGTVTVNPGIDIAVRKAAVVTAAASGAVSLVHWLPGYGTLVIVEHPGGYRTVYANLELAAVGRGRKVNAGDRVGRAGRRGGRDFVHFEVWRGSDHVDPEGLLGK